MKGQLHASSDLSPRKISSLVKQSVEFRTGVEADKAKKKKKGSVA
jgi:hypothetical protein